MRLRIPTCCAAIALLATTTAFAGNIVLTERLVREFPLDLAGSFWIDNPTGSIEIIGVEGSNVTVTATKVTTAVDKSALKEGRDQTEVSFEGDEHVRLVRTILSPARNGSWSSSISYSVRVPRSVHVKVASKFATRIHISNIAGNVTVNTFNGLIQLDGVTGPSIIDTVNGRVVYDFATRPQSNVQIQAVNADIDVFVPADAGFNWVADTLKGDVVTNMPARVEFVGSVFRGTVNAPGGPTLTTQTLLGNVRLLAKGANARTARSLRQVAASDRVSPPQPLLLRPAQKVQLPIVDGHWIFAASIADVSVGEIRGSAQVETGAGEIQLGVVFGDCNVRSLGGPLDLGDIMGPLTARTGGGDVLIRSARLGGTVWTAGGIIRLLYTGGPTKLQSGGGDIMVRQAAGPVSAETQSGDISITVDPNQRTEKIEGRTLHGSITINVSPRFAADVDAVVLTSNPDMNGVQSDFTGLAIRRDQVGNRTRIHATGKVNGGGERVELYAEEGDIHITTTSVSPVTVMSPVR
jgi:DUF4097 and DUF4098 domain-containing protein YvlB